MEDKNELSDIVLEKDDNKAVKTKRILLIAALLILVFLLVLVVMRVINKPEQTNTQSKLVLPPEPIVKEVEAKKDDQLFKQVPIMEDEADKKESFEDMVRSLKEKEIKKQEDVVQPIEEAKEVIKEAAKAVETPIVETSKVTKVAEPKQIQPVVETKPSTTATNGVYIQVGATSKHSPDKKFLSTITNKKYEYKLLPIVVNGQEVTKILIGPYANTTAAKNALTDIKASINKDAFIYRVK